MKLKKRLRELAAFENHGDDAQKQFQAYQAELSVLRRQRDTVGRNMALADTKEQREYIAKVFDELGLKIAKHERTIEEWRPATLQTDPEKEVEAALEVLHRLGEIADESTASWSAAGEAFKLTNTRLFLRFEAVERGRKKINVPASGVVTFGSTPPPAPLYVGPTDRAIVRRMLATGESVIAIPSNCSAGSSEVGQNVIRSVNVKRGTRRCT